jgi:hypothetical protein
MVSNWTMAKLDREARRLAQKTGSVTEARAALIALNGHPTR